MIKEFDWVEYASERRIKHTKLRKHYKDRGLHHTSRYHQGKAEAFQEMLKAGGYPEVITNIEE